VRSPGSDRVETARHTCQNLTLALNYFEMTDKKEEFKLPEVLNKQYEIVNQIGAGAYGTV
jgi:hypothetical protein